MKSIIISLNRNEEGYTLLEMIITIGLIGIAIGMSSFGLSTIYNSNVNARANELVSEIRIVSTKEMASKDGDFELEFTKIGDHYYAYTRQTLAGVTTTIKSIKLPNGMTIEKNISGSWTGIESLPKADRSFTFDPSSGRLTSNGNGRYKVASNISTRVIEFVVVKESGRTYIDE